MSSAAPPFLFVPGLAAAPIPAAGTVNGMCLYTDGTSALLSVNGGAYAALMTAAGGTFTGPVTITAASTVAVDPLAVKTSGTIGVIERILFADPAGGANLTGTVIGLFVDLSYNNTNAAALTGLSISIPATTANALANNGALNITSSATKQFTMYITDAITTGTSISFNHSATHAAGGYKFLVADLTTGVTPGAIAVTGISLALPATTAAAAAGIAALAINSDATLQRVLDIDCANTSGTLAILRYGASTTLTSTALVGVDIDLSTNVVAATNDPAVTGLIVRIPATDRATTNGEGAIVVSSTATRARAFDLTVRTAAMDLTGLLAIRWGGATTQTGSLYGFACDMQTNLTPDNTNEINGYQVVMPATTHTTSSGFAVNAFTAGASNAFRGIHYWARTSQSGGTQGLFRGDFTIATTLSAAFTGLVLDFTTNVTPGAQAVTGVSIAIPATSAANAAAQAAIYVNSDATAARVLDIDIANTSGVYVNNIRWGASTTLAGTTGLFLIDAVTNVVLNGQLVEGFTVRVGAGAAATSSCWVADYRATAGSTAGIMKLNCGTGMTLSGALTGIVLDLATNVTPGANAVLGIDIALPASASTSSRGIKVASAVAAAGYCIEAQVNGAGGRGILFLSPANSTQTGILSICSDQGTAARTANICYFSREATWSVAGTDSQSYFYFQNSASYSTNALVRSGHLVDIQQINNVVLGATVTYSGALLNINHAPTINSGTTTDTSIGVNLAMTPASANATVGIRVTVGPNMSGPALDLVSPGSGANVAFIQMNENGTSDAAAGAANSVRLYARDNGAGKTQLMAIFSSGASQQVAIQP